MIDVTVYSTKTCPHCGRLKHFLKLHGVSFVEVDLEENKFAANKLMKELEEIRLPVTEIKGEYVLGYNIAKIKELLNLKG